MHLYKCLFVPRDSKKMVIIRGKGGLLFRDRRRPSRVFIVKRSAKMQKGDGLVSRVKGRRKELGTCQHFSSTHVPTQLNQAYKALVGV